MKKNLILILFLIILMTFFAINTESYPIKISLTQENTLCEEINSSIANKIQDEFLKINEIKNFITIINPNNCEIFVNLKFLSNFKKEEIISKLERKINHIKKDIKQDFKTIYFENNHLEYPYYLIISSNNASYKILKNYTDIIETKILNQKICENVLTLPDNNIAYYIYYKNSDLVKYDINLEDLIKTIEKNNQEKNSFQTTREMLFKTIKINSKIQNLEDIKNIAIPFKNNSYQNIFLNIFEIKESFQEPLDGLIKYDNKNAFILALSKKKYYPNFLFNYKIKNLKTKLQKELPSYISIDYKNYYSNKKLEIFFENNNSLFSTIENYKKLEQLFQKENIEKAIFFIGINLPKYNKENIFYKNEKNKIVLLASAKNYKKIKNILKENNFFYDEKIKKEITLKEENLENLYLKINNYKNKKAITPSINKSWEINYSINNNLKNKFSVDNKEILNSINAKTQGIIADYFQENTNKIPIILKNNDNFDEIYIYSKKFKNLIPLHALGKNELKNNFSTISLKNGKYFAKIKIYE